MKQVPGKTSGKERVTKTKQSPRRNRLEGICTQFVVPDSAPYELHTPFWSLRPLPLPWSNLLFPLQNPTIAMQLFWTCAGQLRQLSLVLSIFCHQVRLPIQFSDRVTKRRSQCTARGISMHLHRVPGHVTVTGSGLLQSVAHLDGSVRSPRKGPGKVSNWECPMVQVRKFVIVPKTY